MRHGFKVFARETRSKVIVGTSGKREFGGKRRHSRTSLNLRCLLYIPVETLGSQMDIQQLILR